MILTTYNYRLIVCLPSASCVVIVSILFNPLKILTDKPALINGGRGISRSGTGNVRINI